MERERWGKRLDWDCIGGRRRRDRETSIRGSLRGEEDNEGEQDQRKRNGVESKDEPRAPMRSFRPPLFTNRATPPRTAPTTSVFSSTFLESFPKSRAEPKMMS